MANIYEPIEKVLISEEQIKARICEIAKEIDRDYEGKEPMMLSVLTGSFMFASDLMRSVSVPTSISFVFASSYGNSTVSCGNVEIQAGKGFEPAGKDIIIVEDIMDSGRTLSCVRKYLLDQGAKSVEICTFLDKPSRRVVDIDAKYKCFEVPDEFVVGYGLDFNYQYRQYPFVGVLKSEYYE
ncbi:MAG: hypoxanthine phosphoribosyltransferase [Ruminococcaceae bacterium]|nr:hypoxanthine phosphoribosyltransferase [Oscillospiraceae bacterium]